MSQSLQVPVVWAGLAAAGLAGCVDTTGGEHVTFDAVVRNVAAEEGDPQHWVDAETGWSVLLDHATLAVGPVYLWSDQPLLDVNGIGRTRSQPMRHPFDWLVPTARANGADQFRAGFLRAEVTEQIELDVLHDTQVELGRGEGTAGPIGSGEVWLEPWAGGETLRLRGVATKADQTVPFALDLTFDDRWVKVDEGQAPAVVRRLRGLPVEGTLVEDGRLEVGVDHRAALRGIDWATLPAEQPEGGPVYAVDLQSTAGWTLSQRLRTVGSSGPWSLQWTAPRSDDNGVR